MFQAFVQFLFEIFFLVVSVTKLNPVSSWHDMRGSGGHCTSLDVIWNVKSDTGPSFNLQQEVDPAGLDSS